MVEFIIEHWLSIASIAIQCGIFRYAHSAYQQYRQKQEEEEKIMQARDKALRSLLRTEIINICHKTEKEGFMPIHNLENINDMYESYRTLGGNGAIKEMYHKIIEYPQYDGNSHHDPGK